MGRELHGDGNNPALTSDDRQPGPDALWLAGPKLDGAMYAPSSNVPFLTGPVLFDTGSNTTFIEETMVPAGLPVGGTLHLNEGARGIRTVPLYKVKLAFPGTHLPTREVLMAPYDVEGRTPGLRVVLGGNHLRLYVITYDGPVGEVTLTTDEQQP